MPFQISWTEPGGRAVIKLYPMRDQANRAKDIVESRRKDGADIKLPWPSELPYPPGPDDRIKVGMIKIQEGKR